MRPVRPSKILSEPDRARSTVSAKDFVARKPPGS